MVEVVQWRSTINLMGQVQSHQSELNICDIIEGKFKMNAHGKHASGNEKRNNSTHQQPQRKEVRARRIAHSGRRATTRRSRTKACEKHHPHQQQRESKQKNRE